MRLLSIILIISLTACTMVASQQPSEEAKKEAEFHELLKKANAAQETNRTSIKAADTKTSKIITTTTKNIVSLKNEVNQLKSQLNEANKKIDSVILPDANVPFQLFSIPGSKENR
jgi:seryl-tRNA synthetase